MLNLASFLICLKRLLVNIAFIDALSQMPIFYKIFERNSLQKEKVFEHETIALGQECSGIVLNKLFAKLKVHEGFCIPS